MAHSLVFLLKVRPQNIMIFYNILCTYYNDIHKNDTLDLNAQVNGVRSEHH